MITFIGNYVVNVDVTVESESSEKLLLVTYLEHSKTKAKAIAASFGELPVRIGKKIYPTKGVNYCSISKHVRMGRDTFVFTCMISKEVGKDYLITSINSEEEDYYNFLMCNYKLPLLREWTPCLMASLNKVSRNRYAAKEFMEYSHGLSLHGKKLTAGEIIVHDFSLLTEEDLEEAVAELISQGHIKVANHPSLPLQFENLDSYIELYGKGIVECLEREIMSLTPLKGTVDSFVSMKKKLKVPQAACVNGIISLVESGSRYGFMVEGMGSGKTFQAMAVVDGYFNSRWLKAHPGKTLKDMYLSGREQPKYRNWLMAPSHLLEKWKKEIEEEIPFSQVKIITSFRDILEIKNGGKERTGRQWYLISKDFCKLGSLYSPIPTVTASRNLAWNYCKDCYVEDGIYVYQIGKGNKARCPRCAGRHFAQRILSEKAYGMVCPACDHVLIKYRRKMYENEEFTESLCPEDFATRSNENNCCYNCGNPLWGVDVKPISTGFSFQKETKPSKWYKISHYRNFSRKGRKTAFVLRNHEEEYFNSCNIPTDGIKVVEREYGPRKTSPSVYIRKYLKGYFDFAVLDEVHKYESGGSAQSNAAFALSSVSKFTLGLTGTISNGMADSFFYLLYMLDPGKMKKLGYDYNSVMPFSLKYGCVETVYEVSNPEGGVYNSSSRGVQRESPKVKPGISPFLFTDFLLEKSVFLDLSDMSSELPPLVEKLEMVEMDEDLNRSMNRVLNLLKSCCKQGEGRKVLSQILNFGMSYPDKPYGRHPIMSPSVDGLCLANPTNHEEYAKWDVLLPKEKRLVEIITSELEEGRNSFVYASFSGDEETSVLHRLKLVIEKHCNLSGRVFVLEAGSVEAKKREAYIHQKAAEGYKVFVCNPKLVETGLDLCFTYQGKFYNFATIIFFQLTYELAVMWQASRRGYRLIQPEECRIYWMAYENTLQAAALQIMAEKQVATAAIQGKFSAEGLASMAKGVDPRIRMAQMLSEGDLKSGSRLKDMFQRLEKERGLIVEDERYGIIQDVLTYHELMGQGKKDQRKKGADRTNSLFSKYDSFESLFFLGIYGMEEETAIGLDVESPQAEFLVDTVDFIELPKLTLEAKKSDKKKGKPFKEYSIFDLI